MSGLVLLGREICRYVFGEVGLMSGFVRRGRFSVGTCPAKSGRIQRSFLSVGTCAERSVFCRNIFGEAG